ncbi:hypothetical protein TBLA_0A09790 [Henningerozyma blattae CBS 6284]|uniref:Tr-type G domain-containing protein n=1 Tax=Henningerozyma blattae (strain ATCC 34711 / CBS 6284 / DSM 70876 / NBRC 10599 / NRRL Y-10934 / UCD 77-7) TaxID=1071380 RepID=I2GXB0_HENB6|nr:hypothetical protein TBLA_0A09790 [Tetrapisispora blattae CBS 6284]CCH58762.1 hypothetical protein TBLA_0A09790 [Tetrapisispora blattae CBS 6284]
MMLIFSRVLPHPTIKFNILRNLIRYNSTKINNVVPANITRKLQERIEQIPIENYRNFSIVAHVDHGKSTLSDRLLEITGVIDSSQSNKQVLDKLEVERERGITIKAQTCSMFYYDKRTKQDYLLHLVDTPGHVDFRGEVTRSYASCGGALLLVDATQGIQAQTMANFYLAFSMDLKMIPVINKVDLETSDIERTNEQLEQVFEMDRKDAIPVSAKTGLNVSELLLPAIIDRIPPPTGKLNKPFRCLLVDSWYDSYNGVVLLVYVVDGKIKKGDKITTAQTRKRYDVKEAGIMYPDRIPTGTLSAGQVGYILCGMKNSREAKNGDTIMKIGEESLVEILPGFEEPKAMVFVGAFPSEGTNFKQLEDDIERLVLNDRSVSIQRETSSALGQGWRLGFLGTLHASVFCDRLEKEYGTQILLTPATVPYTIVYKDGTIRRITKADEFPTLLEKKTKVSEIREPYTSATITVPEEYLGDVIKLCEEDLGKSRGIFRKDLRYMNLSSDSKKVNVNKLNSQIILQYDIPLQVLVDNFFEKLKSASRGFANLDYDNIEPAAGDVVKLELLVNGESIDALSQVIHRNDAIRVGSEWVKRFKKHVKSQLYEVIIQARIEEKNIVARETIKARKKDVLAKLHASDISRRKKLLVNQKKGKQTLKRIGKVNIGKDVYGAFLRKVND